MPSRANKYGIHKIFGPTIQGEGPMAGVPCIFVRFSGCNMWDGRESTRAESQCPFCDTDFFSKEIMTKEEVADIVASMSCPGVFSLDWLWLSGGEPMLQVDEALLEELKTDEWKIAIETNGTVEIKPNIRRYIDHLTVSPKVPAEQLKQREGDTLKVLYPHPNKLITPENFDNRQDLNFKYRYLQPIALGDQPIRQHTEDAILKLYELDDWRLSTQTHKYIGVE